MDIYQATDVLKALASGIDPNSGELFPQQSPYNNPETIRALFCAINFIGSAKKPKKSLEEKQADNLNRGLPKNAGLPWTDDMRNALAKGYANALPIEQLATEFERSRGAIIAELERQGLIKDDMS